MFIKRTGCITIECQSFAVFIPCASASTEQSKFQSEKQQAEDQ